MAKLYIANATRQTQVIHVRVPEMKKPLIVEIKSGNQAEIPDMNASQVDAIIRHLVRYGAVSRSSVHGKLKDFDGVIYALDKPVGETEYHYGNEEVLDHAQDRSVKEAVKASLAADLALRDSRGKRFAKEVTSEVAEMEASSKVSKKNMRMSVTVAEGGQDSRSIM